MRLLDETFHFTFFQTQTSITVFDGVYKCILPHHKISSLMCHQITIVYFAVVMTAALHGFSNAKQATGKPERF